LSLASWFSKVGRLCGFKPGLLNTELTKEDGFMRIFSVTKSVLLGLFNFNVTMWVDESMLEKEFSLRSFPKGAHAGIKLSAWMR
jgi:hypothetical protein